MGASMRGAVKREMAIRASLGIWVYFAISDNSSFLLPTISFNLSSVKSLYSATVSI